MGMSSWLYVTAVCIIVAAANSSPVAATKMDSSSQLHASPYFTRNAVNAPSWHRVTIIIYYLSHFLLHLQRIMKEIIHFANDTLILKLLLLCWFSILNLVIFLLFVFCALDVADAPVAEKRTTRTKKTVQFK